MTAADLLHHCADFKTNLACEIPANIFDLMPNGVAYCRLLYQDGKPYDFVYLYTNPAFHTLTGLGAVKNKPVSEIIPGICNSNPELFKIYGEVAAGGASENIEYFIDGLQLWVSIQVFSHKPEHFISIFTVINERKSVEHALNINEKRYKGLLEDQTETICRIRADGVIIFVNTAFCRLFGKSPESLIGQAWQPIAWPADVSLIHEKLKSLSPDNPTVTIENRIVTANGVVRWGQFVNRAFFDDQGVLLEMQSVGRDITERKQAEKALEKSQRDLNHAQAVAQIGSWRRDVCNDALEWSDENFRIFGIAKGTSLTYKSFLNVVHPFDRDAVEATWKLALTGKPYDIKHRIIVDGQIKWVHEQAELEFDEQGELLGAFGTTKDITDLTRSQHALQKERVFLRQVIDAVPSVIFVKDRQGRFLLCNQALADSYETSPKAIIGLTESSFNSNVDELLRFYQNDLAVINERIPKYFEDEKVTHVDGTVHWYNVVKLPLIENKKCNKVLVVATDITENMLSREALGMANQRKDEFLAMLAHELRNPLAPIRNAVQLLNKLDTQDLNLTKTCQVIDRQVTHMVRLLDDLLDVARIMQDKITLKLERINLSDIINNAVETSQPLIESRRQELIISQTSTPQWVQGDRIRLAQVLSNLLNNAAKYTDEDGRIYLNLSRVGAEVVIEVQDRGIGISAANLPHIFDLFTQADHTLAHAQGGLGIGLTLVRQLIEKHGGTVTAKSAGIGFGSVFTLRLPAVAAEISVHEPLPTDCPLQPPKCRILVVDDYIDAAESLVMVLEAEGHEVKTANCGLQALEKVQVFQPQVVLLDIGLPDLDGYEVAKRLRSIPENKNMLVIALTGYGERKKLEFAESSGFDHYLLKPVDFDKLFALLALSPLEPSASIDMA